jgi:hypothetical protein
MELREKDCCGGYQSGNVIEEVEVQSANEV